MTTNTRHNEQVGSQQGTPKVVREYRRPMPATWWLDRGPYLRYMLRESTSLAVTAYAWFLLVLAALGPAAFQAVLVHPATVALHVVLFLLAVHHSVTWFNSVPQVIVVWWGRQRIGPRWIAGIHYAGWLVVTVVVLTVAKIYAGG